VDVSSYPLFEYPPHDLALAVKMAEAAREHGLSLFHVHYAIPHAIAGFLAQQMLGDRAPRMVTTLHGTDITIVGQDRSFFEITRFGIERSDAVTAVSKFLQRMTCKEFQVTKPIDVIPNFVDLEQYSLDEISPRPSALLRQFDTRTVLCVALRRGGKVIGVQSAEYRGRHQAFTPQQMRIARGIAHLASLALETARLVEELEAADRLKSEFVATMSHELRSPLNIIIGYHELLLDGGFGPLTGAQLEPLRRADRSARELLDLINATLDLSRLEAKRITLDLGDVVVADLVDELGRELSDHPDRPDIEIRWYTPPDLPRLRTDRVKLKMVLKNLVENALKFTERGRVELAAAGLDGGVELRVTDTGVGIAPEARRLIFEPFRQVNAGPGQVRDGAGLGLYIVKQLLAVLGGAITLESEVGSGSTFRVWLPLAAPADAYRIGPDGGDTAAEGASQAALRRTAG
jgi:signal transduction histidine kinase